MRKIKCYLLLTLALCGSLHAAGLGQYGGSWLRAPLGAEAWGRGGAGTAYPTHSMAWWNPALASLQDEVTLTSGGFIRPEGVVEAFLSAEGTIPRTKLGLSASYVYRGIPSLDDLVDAQENLVESASYTTMTTKLGVSYAIRNGWVAGLSFTWFYLNMPVDYGASGTVETAKSSSLGGITLMGGWYPENRLRIAFGIRNLLSVVEMSEEVEANGSRYPVSEDVVAPLVLGVSKEWLVAGYSIQVDSDVEMYLFDSFFQGLDDPLCPIKLGVTWRPIEVVALRAGVRDLLFDASLFSDFEEYELKATPAFTAGVGVIEAIRGLQFNYALSGTGSGAGFDHVFDVTFRF